jgi:alpha-beta hydrolase superfamily lysophospholipase
LANAAESRQLTLRTPDGRDCAVSVWRPRGRRRGLVLFSHGAGSAPRHYLPFILAWARAGFEVQAPLHVDSTEHPETKKFTGFATWSARIHDMRALAASVADTNYVAAGHSYGGLVALTLGGAQAAQPEGVTGALRDPRVVAAIALSPPAPIPKLIEAAGYATLAVPALVQTGDKDIFPGTPADSWRTHLAAYDAAAAGGDRYALVLAGVDHYFGGLICKAEVPGPPQPRQLATATELTTLFLQAYGASAQRARSTLERRLADSGATILQRK